MVDNRDEDNGHDVIDDKNFVEEYCAQQGLMSKYDVDRSETIRLANEEAEKAREQFKEIRNMRMTQLKEPEDISAVSMESVETTPSGKRLRSGPSDSQGPPHLQAHKKYMRRLSNNRRSAVAAKVYAEVWKRVCLTKMENSAALVTAGVNYTHGLEQDRDTLRTELVMLKDELEEERKKTADLEELLRNEKRKNMAMKGSTAAEMKYVQGGFFWDQIRDHGHNYPNDFDLHAGPSQPLASGNSMDNAGLQYLADAPNPSQGEVQSQEFVGSNSQQAGNEILKFSSSMALSQVANENDARDFKTGLTCSQSQDTEKGIYRELPRPSILTGSQFCSQASDLPSFKTPLGSEENPLGDLDEEAVNNAN